VAMSASWDLGDFDTHCLHPEVPALKRYPLFVSPARATGQVKHGSLRRAGVYARAWDFAGWYMSRS